MKKRITAGLFIVVLCASAALAAPQMSGAIFTTGSGCEGTNVNIFSAKEDVYLDGGPARQNAAGLPDGAYWVRVTDPSGAAVLGESLTAVAVVTGGEFAECYHLWSLVVFNGEPGFDDTSNGGGEYKMWVSLSPDYAENVSKTDNFKVKVSNEPPPIGTMTIQKFYDANADGLWTAGEPAIEGWQITVLDAPHEWADSVGYTTASFNDEPGTYTVSESTPAQFNWRATTATQVEATIEAGQTTAVSFGNLCLGAGGGLTLGFWSNKNGEKLYNASVAIALNLRDGSGNHFDPANYKAFRTWILSASATNMAYMLSAQLAAMAQNVANGNVSASALIYAPGTGSANPLGYATVGAVMAEANALLGANGYTVSAGADRDAQEAAKNALDRANNNFNFVQAGPCAFSFN